MGKDSRDLCDEFVVGELVILRGEHVLSDYHNRGPVNRRSSCIEANNSRRMLMMSRPSPIWFLMASSPLSSAAFLSLKIWAARSCMTSLIRLRCWTESSGIRSTIHRLMDAGPRFTTSRGSQRNMAQRANCGLRQRQQDGQQNEGTGCAGVAGPQARTRTR